LALVVVFSVGMPYVLDDARQVHFRYACLAAEKCWYESHLEDGADVEACKSDLEQDPFFGVSSLRGKRWKGPG
jgi:hypothetical protein